MAWHCDPFGHSTTTAEFFKKMGFDALFFARIDDEEKNWRKIN